jgi:hypothetical protein
MSNDDREETPVDWTPSGTRTTDDRHPWRDFVERRKASARRHWKALGVGTLIVGAFIAWAVPKLGDAGVEAVHNITAHDQGPVVVSVLHLGQYDGSHSAGDGVMAPIFLLRVAPSSAPNQDPYSPEYQSWAREHGGIPGQSEYLRFILRGTSDAPTIINSLHAEVVKTRPPVRGNFAWDAGCGIEPVRHIRFNLDDGRASYYNSTAEGPSPTSQDYPLTLRVTRTDTEVVDVEAYTARSDADWDLKLSYTGPDGSSGVVTVNDAGKPFRVSAVAAGSARYRPEGRTLKSIRLKKLDVKTGTGPVTAC